MPVSEISETQNAVEHPETTTQSISSRKSILALSVFALGLNACAAVYTLSPADFALPDVSSLAELLPHQKAFEPKPDPVLAALKDIQTVQQQHLAALQESTSSLQQSATLRQQDSNTLALLRQSITDEKVDVKKISSQITDEHSDVKKMSAQISTLIAKIDSLQSAVAPEFTSSIPRAHGRKRLTGELRKDAGKPSRPFGPVSVGGAPLTVPAAASSVN
jgi:septal ring factor EnvC (AmiA/AmiB activator)